ncbi:MAG: glycosyltransferase [Nanoarchaeota archaeon]
MKLSVCMIVKNEEHCLARALDSIKDLADEIVVVDTGSTDRTQEIAKEYTSHVYSYPWNDDFSAARNFSLSKATGDWILVLDADEVIAKEDHSNVRHLLSQEYIAYAFPQMSYTNDVSQFQYTPFLAHDKIHQKYISYAHSFSGYISCHIVRLFRNHKNVHFVGAVHESVDASCTAAGNIMKTDLWIHHYQFERGTEALRAKQLHYLKIYLNHLDTYVNKARAYRDIASIYYTHTIQYDKAIEFFTKSLALNNKNKKTYLGLGLSYLKLNKHSDAYHVFEDALRVFPHDTQLLHLKQMIHERQKDL